MTFDAKETSISLVNSLWKICESEGYFELVDILQSCSPSLEFYDYDDWNGGTDLCILQLEVTEQLFGQLMNSLSDYETDILDRMGHIFRRYPDKRLTGVTILPLLSEPDNKSGADICVGDLVLAIEKQRDLMINVATGGPRIDDVNDEFKNNRAVIKNTLSIRGIEDPNPFHDLWDWYQRYSVGDFPTYASRRVFVAALYNPLFEVLEKGIWPTKPNQIDVQATGWARVDREIGEARKCLAEATDEIHYQQVGVACREVLVSLAQEVFDSEKHKIEEDIKVSSTDAPRMLAAVIDSELQGKKNKLHRKHATAALELANKTTHDRSGTFRKAATCAEATSSVINLIAIITGKQDP